MKLLFDSNVWLAGFGARGLCGELIELALGLADQESVRVLVCPAVRREVERLLRDKFRLPANEVTQALAVMARLTEVADGGWRPPPDFPDPDDIPIVGAGVTAGADLFVTGDKALLALGRIEGLPIVTPREAYIKLRGLE